MTLTTDVQGDSAPDEATRLSTAPAPPPRESVVAPVRRAWRQLVSMRTALLLLFLLALASVPGSFLPQRDLNPVEVQSWSAEHPTLAAVQTLAYSSAGAGRGALLTAAYCLGLGVPFVLNGLAFRRALGAFAVVKRHYSVVMGVGGALLLVVGLLLVSGLWETLMLEVRGWVAGFETAV